MTRDHNTTEHSKKAKKFRRSSLKIASKAALEKKCALCDSKEELELDHIDHNPFNNDIVNLRFLCKACHMSHHSGGFRKREDYQKCFVCQKIRICAPSPIDGTEMCSSCFVAQCKDTGLNQHQIYSNIGNETLYSLWCSGRPKYRK